MNKIRDDITRDILVLLDYAKQQDSGFGRKLRDEPHFFARLAQTIEALVEFYLGCRRYSDAANTFREKLSLRFSNSSDSYMGIVGEIEVADRLRQRNVPHRFLAESQRVRTPDLEVQIIEKEVYFEVTTLAENKYVRFEKTLFQQLGGRLISVRDFRPKPGQEEELTRIALHEAHIRITKGYGGPIAYKGDEGTFDLTFSRNPKLDPRYPVVGGWPDARVVENKPFLEFWLMDKLKEKLGQFRANKNVTTQP